MSRSATLSRCSILISIVFLIAFALSADVFAGPSSGKPIRALLVTGGCCHDYSTQKKIIPTGVSARANVKWTVVHQGGNSKDARIPLFEDPNWANGYDVVVHNQCFAEIGDEDWVKRVLKPHRNGTPGIFIHCAMHCFLDLDGPLWEEAVGVRTNSHKSKKPIVVQPTEKNFITKPLGSEWTTPAGELYQINEVLDGTTPLATGHQVGSDDKHTNIWTLNYGPKNTRMFGTTLGHHNSTMADSTFLDMLTRGILWAVGEDHEKNIHAEREEDRKRLNEFLGKADSSGQDRPDTPDNALLEQDTKASSVQDNNDNFARHAVDGDRRTRWCASDDTAPQWLQVNLDEPTTLQSVRIHWEKPDTAYRYKVQVSGNGQDWTTVVDASENSEAEQVVVHTFDPVEATHLRVKYLGNDSGYWGSIWELEAYSSKNPPDIKKETTSNISPDIDVPDSFEASLFAAPPEVNYPTCITASPSGHVFAGVDPQGSLGKKKGNGKILRLTDMDGDGKADRIKTFAKLDHPRGLVYNRGRLWVLHPPKLSLLIDEDLDGTAERRKTLVEGVSSKWIRKRGVDHAVNGIRMGIDGWIYIAVGDFGMHETKAIDGTTLHKRGGGVVRIRPDGSEMEVYCWELRNIYDVAIDPFMNLYTRDNTNDGQGWNVRVSHLIQSGHYGYPARYSDFPEEIMPPLNQYGGGSGTGALYLHDLRWPEKYNDLLYTADWGTGQVYAHRLEPAGPTFQPDQESFMKLSKPTDLDIDGTGRLFVSSWKNGGFKYSDENVGYIARVKPESFVPHPPENPDTLSNRELVRKLTAPSARQRKLYQRALLSRDTSQGATELLLSLAGNQDAAHYARVAAIFTLKQMHGAGANKMLGKLINLQEIKPYVLRALTDRKSQLDNLPLKPFVNALQDQDPDVRAQALISLGRMEAKDAAENILPLTQRRSGKLPDEEPVHAQPDPGRVIPLLAVRTLIKINARKACMNAVGGDYTRGALSALSRMHDRKVVSGLVRRLKNADRVQLKKQIVTSLIRLYHREGPYEGDWWGTKPNPAGPYEKPETWEESKRISDVLRSVKSSAGKEITKHLKSQLERHAVEIDGLATN